jgi:hypothetical protein
MNTGHDAGYWIFAAGIPLVFLLVVLGVVLRTGARRTGSDVVLKWFMPLALIVALLVFGQAGYDLLSARVRDQIATGFFVLMTLSGWAFLIYSVWRQRQAGALLLDLGPPAAPRQRGIIGFIIVSVLAAGHSGLDWRATGFRSAYGLTQTMMWATSALVWLLVLRERVRITERGIAAFGEFIEWERLLGYEWLGTGSERLLLRVRRRIPFIGVRTGLLAVPVPLHDRNHLQDILAQHISNEQTR